MTRTSATPTIRLRGVGRKPAVEAQELTVGDTLMWNEGETTKVTAIAEASPQFLRITEQSTRTGKESGRRLKKTRLVARVVSAPKETIEAEVKAQQKSAPNGPAEEYPANSTTDRTGKTTPDTHRSLRDAVEEAGVLVLPEEDHCCTGAKIQPLADTDHVLLSLQVGGLTHAHQQPSEREEAAEMISKIRQALPAAHWNVVTPLPDGLIIAPVKGTTH